MVRHLELRVEESNLRRVLVLKRHGLVALLDEEHDARLQARLAILQRLVIAGGLLKATVYGMVVAVCGCLRGMQCGRSAAAVGNATTSAVVISCVMILVADYALTSLLL